MIRLFMFAIKKMTPCCFRREITIGLLNGRHGILHSWDTVPKWQHHNCQRPLCIHILILYGIWRLTIWKGISEQLNSAAFIKWEVKIKLCFKSMRISNDCLFSREGFWTQRCSKNWHDKNLNGILYSPETFFCKLLTHCNSFSDARVECLVWLFRHSVKIQTNKLK